MGDFPDNVSASFNVNECIEKIEELIRKCDGAGRSMVALHLSQALDLLDAEVRLLEAHLSKDK